MTNPSQQKQPPPDSGGDKLQLSPIAQRVADVSKLCGGMVKTVARALPKGSPTDPERFCQLSMTVLLANLAEVKDNDIESKSLVFASDNSLKRVIVQAAELDLQPGGALGLCWFIRYGDSATFQVGVWGYVALLLRHPDVAKVHSDVIYQADKYSVVRGSEPKLIHEPAWEKQPGVSVEQGGRGQRLGAYAVLTRKDEVSDFVVMPEWDLVKARQSSKAPNSPAYEKWPDEMAQRSVIKRGQKRWPRALELMRALEVDENDSVRADLADDVTGKVVDTSGTTAPHSAQEKAVSDMLSKRALGMGGVSSMGATAGTERREPAGVGK